MEDLETYREDLLATANHLEELTQRLGEMLPPDYPRCAQAGKVLHGLADWMSKRLQRLPVWRGAQDDWTLGTGPYAPQQILNPEYYSDLAQNLHELRAILRTMARHRLHLLRALELPGTDENCALEEDIRLRGIDMLEGLDKLCKQEKQSAQLDTPAQPSQGVE